MLEIVKVVRKDVDSDYIVINKADMLESDVLFDESKDKIEPGKKAKTETGKRADSK